MLQSFFAFTILLFLNMYLSASGITGKGIFRYIDPRPDAKFVNKKTTIVFTPVGELNKNSILKEGALTITGSINYNYNFTFLAASDKRTYILKPVTEFADGEKVTVKFSSAIAAQLKAGSYKTKFNSGLFSSGKYYYRMTANNTTYINKMIVIK